MSKSAPKIPRWQLNKWRLHGTWWLRSAASVCCTTDKNLSVGVSDWLYRAQSILSWAASSPTLMVGCVQSGSEMSSMSTLALCWEMCHLFGLGKSWVLWFNKSISTKERSGWSTCQGCNTAGIQILNISVQIGYARRRITRCETPLMNSCCKDTVEFRQLTFCASNWRKPSCASSTSL